MYECAVCKKVFTYKQNLDRHVTCHTNERHKCQFCQKEFSRIDSLNRHTFICRQKPLTSKVVQSSTSGSLQPSTSGVVQPSRSGIQTVPSNRKRDSTDEEPPLKKMKKRNIFEADPLDCPPDIIPDLSEACRKCYVENWHQIRTRQCGGKLRVKHLFRLDEESDISQMIKDIFMSQGGPFKMNLAFGFILQNEETKEVRYFYPSENSKVFEYPVTIATVKDVEKLKERLEDVDWLEYVRQKKPNSKWNIAIITNVDFTLYHLTPNNPIGAVGDEELPGYIANNTGLDGLWKSPEGVPYDDNLCFFRCLARHRGAPLSGLERTTKKLALTYLSTLDDPLKFKGVRLTDLHNVDKLFDIHTTVYSIEESGAVNLIHRAVKMLTGKEAENSLKVNLWNGHFSFIKSIEKYSASFRCRRCQKFFKKAWNLQRHERGCEGKVKMVYPGGMFHPPKTIFEKLEEEGVAVPEELKFSRFRATYDIEVYYPKEGIELPNKTNNLEWKAEHHLLSISVASNVPRYEEPKCFVIEKEGGEECKRVVEKFVNYLNEIRENAGDLEEERYAGLKRNILEVLSSDEHRLLSK